MALRWRECMGGDEAFHLLLQVPKGQVADFRTRWVEAGLSIAEQAVA